MTTSEYVQKIVELIDDRPSRIDLDKLLDEICVRAKIAEARRARQEGRWSTHEQVMGRMWKRIYSKFDDATGRRRPRQDRRGRAAKSC